MSPLSSMQILSLLLAGSGLLHGVSASPAHLVARSLKSCVASALQGTDADIRVVQPTDATWEDARVGALVNPENPAIIAFARSAAEIPALISCAKASNIRAVPRAGRHHFESWSALNNTLVIDVAHINYIKLSSDLSTATIGAGANLGDIYTTLSQQKKTVLGGICPTVSIGGFLTTGGYNLQLRKLGMAADQVLSLSMVLANGTTVTASPSKNSDLFWAARGGGQFGILVEVVMKAVTLPRSAMASITFPDPTTRYAAAKIYHDWAPKQIGELTTQFNLYGDHSQFYGWLLGGTKAQMQALLQQSGLLDIPGAQVYIDGDCSTENSRMFWVDGTNDCTDDVTAYSNFLQSYNTMPIHLVPIEPTIRFDTTPALPSAPAADLWPRFDVASKTYFVVKSKPLTDATLKELVDRSGALPADAGFWAEITSFNITAPKTTSAFAWQDEAYVLHRVQVVGGSPTYKAWMDDFDKWYRPKVGEASYSGYIDAGITSTVSSPYKSYYGKNVCKLVQVKRRYDPTDFFKNPFSIPTTVPAGVAC